MTRTSEVSKNSKQLADESPEPDVANEVNSKAPDKHDTQSTASNGSAQKTPASSHPRGAAVLDRLRKLERRAIEVPIVGKLHAPDTPDLAYFAGMTALIAIGIVELPIALVLLGGHVLIKQHHSRSLSAIGEVVEDALGH